MEITVNDFIKKLQALKPSLRDKPIVIACPNGETTDPSIKMLLKDKMNIFGGNENVEAMIITWRE